MNNACDQHENKHKWGKIGPSYLLSENGDLSFLFFSRQRLVENIQGKFQKNLSGTFFSEESPYCQQPISETQGPDPNTMTEYAHDRTKKCKKWPLPHKCQQTINILLSLTTPLILRLNKVRAETIQLLFLQGKKQHSL